MKTIKVGNDTATLTGYSWQSDNIHLAGLLNALVEADCPDAGDPDPETILAQAAINRIGGEIVTDPSAPAPDRKPEGVVLDDIEPNDSNAVHVESAAARCARMGIDDNTPFSEVVRCVLLGDFIGLALTRAAKQALSGGNWVTVEGNHVYVKGGQIIAGHIPGATEATGMGEEGTQALLAAHHKGQIQTDTHLFESLKAAHEHIKAGDTEADAVHKAVAEHGVPAKAPEVEASQTKTHQIWKFKQGFVPVTTLGHNVTPEDATNWAQEFHFPPGATADLIDAINQGKIKTDHDLGKVMADTLHIKNYTKQTEKQALAHVLAGKDPAEFVAEHKVAEKAKKDAAKGEPGSKHSAAVADSTPVEKPDDDKSGHPKPISFSDAQKWAEGSATGDAVFHVGVNPGKPWHAGILAGGATGVIGLYPSQGKAKEPQGITDTAPVVAKLTNPAIIHFGTSFSDYQKYGVDPLSFDTIQSLKDKGHDGVIFVGHDGKITGAIAMDATSVQPVTKKSVPDDNAEPTFKEPDEPEKTGQDAPKPGAPEPEPEPEAPDTPTDHHVTIQGHKFDLPADSAEPATPASLEKMKSAGVKVTDNGEAAIKSSIASGDTATENQLHQTAAIAQASVDNKSMNSLNAGAWKHALEKYHGSVEELLDAAHNGDSDATAIVAHMGAHSFKSPAAKQAIAAAAKAAQQKATFNAASPADHTFKKIGGQTGHNDGALYEMPDGQQNYVKTPSNPGVAHNEHLANKVYQALGISAPESTVFQQDGQTKYASQIIPNKGDLQKHGISKETAQGILQGFAADALLGNFDVLGNGDSPLSNVVLGEDGTPHRIDNGGALLYSGTGDSKPANQTAEFPWQTFITKNANYAKVFSTAGYSTPEQIPGLAKQIKSILALRDQSGGWDKFIQQAAPGMSASDRAKAVQCLNDRSEGLQEVLTKLPSSNSIVGQRAFAYKPMGASVEQQIIAHHKQNAPALTATQQTAVQTFKGSAYHDWNRALIGNQPLTKSQVDRTLTLDKMFAQPGMTIGVDSALSRQISLDSDEQDKLTNLTEGDIIAHTPVFQSTSVSTGVWSGNTHFCILAPAETPGVPPAAYTSMHQHEHEILLPRGMSYRVVAAAGPGTEELKGQPEGWQWKSGGARVVMEAIVPGVNDVEANISTAHLIQGDAIVSNWQNKSAAALSAGPAPNISQLPSGLVPTLEKDFYPPTKKPAKSKKV